MTVHVTSGLASNGHLRFWARCAEHGFTGPFRATEERARADADRHAAPEWKVLDINVGLVAHDGTVLEYVSGPSGPTRFSLTNAREKARFLNRQMREEERHEKR